MTDMTASEELLSRYESSYVTVFGPPKLALERGEDPKLVHVGPITNHAHD